MTKEISPKKQIIQAIIGLLILIVVGAGCSYLLREEIQFYGTMLIENFGLWGLVMGTIITDTSPLPLSSEPVAILGLGADLNLLDIIWTMSLTSHLSGPLGYFLGNIFSKTRLVSYLLNHKLVYIKEFVQKHGIKAVCMGALLPIPYALTTWTAGAVGISFWGTFWASSLRWVKTSLYVYLLSLGWNIT